MRRTSAARTTWWTPSSCARASRRWSATRICRATSCEVPVTATARHVLVVGDERGTQGVIRSALADEGLGCELAENAEQARKLADDPAVGAVLVDVRLPQRGVLEVLRALREGRPSLGGVVIGTAGEQ